MNLGVKTKKGGAGWNLSKRGAEELVTIWEVEDLELFVVSRTPTPARHCGDGE